MEDHTLSLLLHALLLIKDCCLEGLLFAEEPCKQQADVMLSVAVAATGSQPIKVFWKVTTSHQLPLSNWHSWKKQNKTKHKFLGTSSCCRCEDSTSFSFPAQTVSDIWINMPDWLQIHFSHWHSFSFLQVSEILAFCLIETLQAHFLWTWHSTFPLATSMTRLEVITWANEDTAML